VSHRVVRSCVIRCGNGSGQGFLGFAILYDLRSVLLSRSDDDHLLGGLNHIEDLFKVAVVCHETGGLDRGFRSLDIFGRTGVFHQVTDDRRVVPFAENIPNQCNPDIGNHFLGSDAFRDTRVHIRAVGRFREIERHGYSHTFRICTHVGGGAEQDFQLIFVHEDFRCTRHCSLFNHLIVEFRFGVIPAFFQ